MTGIFYEISEEGTCVEFNIVVVSCPFSHTRDPRLDYRD